MSRALDPKMSMSEAPLPCLESRSVIVVARRLISAALAAPQLPTTQAMLVQVLLPPHTRQK